MLVVEKGWVNNKDETDVHKVGVHHKNRKLHEKIYTLKMDRYILSLGDVGYGFSYFLGLFQVIMANPEGGPLLFMVQKSGEKTSWQGW